MEIRITGPQQFFKVIIGGDVQYLPAKDLVRNEGEGFLMALTHTLGVRPSDFNVVYGYGVFIEEVEIWIFGKSAQSALQAAAKAICRQQQPAIDSYFRCCAA